MRSIASFLIQLAQSTPDFWSTKLQDKFDIVAIPKEPEHPLDPIILRQCYNILSLMPAELVKACGIRKLYLSYAMGPNKTYYPNHGYFIDDLVTLNADIFEHPDVCDDFFDHHGYFINRPTQTILHEFAHGFDHYHGELSIKEPWTKLSGWSPVPKTGLKRLIIQETGSPQILGEWYYDSKAGFTRFYAKRNPWDDWADSFAFYMGGLTGKLPENKKEYFDNLLAKYPRK